MTRSATARRGRTAHTITRHAQQLTDERGLDGFTMDDLADAAEVSRRTLFNYFPGKVAAVLGQWPLAADDLVEVFRDGGPDQDLVLDLRTLLLGILDVHGVERADLERGRRILRTNARLMSGVHERYLALSAEIVAHVEAREGPTFGAARAQVAVRLLASLLDASLDAYLADTESHDLTHHVDESLRTARSLLGG